MKTIETALLLFFFGCTPYVEIEGSATPTDSSPAPSDVIDSTDDSVLEPDVEVEPPEPVCDAEVWLTDATPVSLHDSGEYVTYVSYYMSLNSTEYIECRWGTCRNDCRSIDEISFGGISIPSELEGPARIGLFAWCEDEHWHIEQVTFVVACECGGIGYIDEHPLEMADGNPNLSQLLFYHRDVFDCP